MEGSKEHERERRTHRQRQAMVLVLLVVAALGLWAALVLGTPTAWAEKNYPAKAGRPILPNSGAQRQAMVEQLQQVNAKLDRIHEALTSGKVKVIAVTEPGQSGVAKNAEPQK